MIGAVGRVCGGDSFVFQIILAFEVIGLEQHGRGR
jgi:hypothetical protein